MPLEVQAWERPAEAGRLLALGRTWKDGNRVEIEFQMALQLQAVDEKNQNHVALMRDPLALFAVDETLAYQPQTTARGRSLAESAVLVRDGAVR